MSTKIINLLKENLSFEDNNQTYKIESLNKEKMTLKVKVYERNDFIKVQEIAFAHIPKKLKSKLNPKNK